ncbi:acyl-CoA dehydrogenase [Amycolatopsis sp.]|uniref:acyl-CoA dehydrogenase n=1 Tax=Amycolatopsis sp. TaxID=37632 RepID=UPI002C0CCFD2|nr:acyl-CoA dehydrogenase [Amycolatopsis sp.]HVV08080.1 acyl-CoA dehydrogenase [Amycolatopsis sp.]
MRSNVAVADTPDQQALADAVTGLLAKQWPAGAAHKQVSDPGSVTELALWPPLAELGLAGLPVPESRGGSGGSWADLAVAMEACGAVLAPTPAVAVAGAIGTLDRLPGEESGALLSRICSGALVPAVAWTERSGLGGARGGFQAELGEDVVRVSGRADVVLSPEASGYLVLAESPDGPVLLAVEPDADGATMRRIEGLDLLRPLGALTLYSTPATVLARGGAAVAAVQRGVVTAGAALASELVGAAGHCLAAAVAYAGERTQFGHPIGSFQAIKHICADLLTGVELARAAARHLAALLDSGASAPELEDAVALALLQATTVARKASADYIQILGGIGFTWEHEAHLYYRRAGAAAPLFGGSAAHRRRLDPTTGNHGHAVTASAPGTPAAELAAHVERLLPAHREKWGSDDSFTARLDWQRTLHAVGWIAPQWPTEFGGRGLGIVDQVACDRVLAEHRAPDLAGVLGVNNVAPTLMRYGTPEQQRYLHGIQSGETVWCQGFSEPGSGSDLASLRTRAVLDGDEFVINGQKIWTSEGMEADYCLLLVRTDPDAKPHKGISALLVPLDTPGITRRPITQITGEGGFAELFFDDVRVPKDALLGPLNEGWTVTMTTLGFERAGVIMMASRLEQTVYDLVGELSGRDLDDGIRLELTDRLVESRLLALLGQRALGRIAAGGAPGAEHSVIKLAWSLAMQAVGDTHLAALGLDGVAGDTTRSAQLAYLRSRAATIAGGTTEIMRNILAERVLGLPR